jgi:hypothetical protein
MVVRRTLALAVLLVGISNFASAQAERCIGALISDTRALDLSEIHSLSRAEIFYRSRNRDSNWAAGISVPIYGVPVQGSAESAESTRERYFSSSSIDWNSDRLVSVATQTLSQNAVAAHRACVEGQLRSGPRILVHDATQNQATVTIIWQSPPGARPTARNASFDITGGKFRRPFQTSWTTGASQAVIIEREPNSDIRIIANIGKESDDVFVSRIPDFPKETRPQCRIETIAPVRTSEACREGFQYAGAIDARAHGGTCIKFNGCDFYTQSVRTRPCARGVYGGPLDSSAHGGTCIVLDDDRYRLTATSSNDPCPRGTTYVGPIDQRAHGGRCLTLEVR